MPDQFEQPNGLQFEQEGTTKDFWIDHPEKLRLIQYYKSKLDVLRGADFRLVDSRKVDAALGRLSGLTQKEHQSIVTDLTHDALLGPDGISEEKKRQLRDILSCLSTDWWRNYNESHPFSSGVDGIESSIETLFADFEHFQTLAWFVLGEVIEPGSETDDADESMLHNLELARKNIELNIIHQLIELTVALPGEDAFWEIWPNKNRVPPEPNESGYKLFSRLRHLVSITKVNSGRMEGSYQSTKTIFDPLVADEKKLVEGEYGRHDHYIPWMSSGPMGNIHDFYGTDIVSVITEEEMKALSFTPEEIRFIYDLVQEELFRRLTEGGYESWEGTAAASVFGALRDPRAIPGLLHHLRTFAPGHTNAFVSHAIKDIVKDPISVSDLESIRVSLPPLMRDALAWFEPDCPFNNFFAVHEGYMQAAYVREAEKHVTYARLIKIAMDVAQRNGLTINQEAIPFILGGNFDLLVAQEAGVPQVLDILISNPSETGAAIAKSGLYDWRSMVPRVFNGLTSPPSKEYTMFPEIIAKEGLGLDGPYIEKLKQLYGLKDLAEGGLARSLMAEGLLFLTSEGEKGVEIARKLIDLCTIAKDDPKRLRDIFRALSIFRKLDAPLPDILSQQSLAEAQKESRKQLTRVISDKLGLAAEAENDVMSQLDFILESDIFEIIPVLLAKFSESRPRVAEVTKEVAAHIVKGDFKQWRESLPTSQEQLSGLEPGQKDTWLSSIDPVTVKVEAGTGRDRIMEVIGGIQRIMSEAKAHLLEAMPGFDFSPHHELELIAESERLVSELKGVQGDMEAKKRLGFEKRKVDAQIKLIQGFRVAEQLTEDNFEPGQFLNVLAGLQSALRFIGGMDQVVNDLGTIQNVFETADKLATVNVLTAKDSDDPLALLKVGTEPRETCQSWRGGGHNYCLMAYVADANKRVINVENPSGEVVGRCIIKLTKIKWHTGETIPAILVEPIYTNSDTWQIYAASLRVILEKAKLTRVAVVIASDINVATGADHSRTIPLISKEAQRLGFRVEEAPAEVYIPQSHNEYEYSDSLGGDISYFGQYRTTSQSAYILFPPEGVQGSGFESTG